MLFECFINARIPTFLFQLKKQAWNNFLHNRRFHDKMVLITPDNKVTKVLPSKFPFLNPEYTKEAWRLDTRTPVQIMKAGGFNQKHPGIKSVIIENRNEYGTGNVVSMTTDLQLILGKIQRGEGYQYLANSFCYRFDLTKVGEVIEIPNNKELHSSEIITLKGPTRAITHYQEVKDGKLVGGWKPMPIAAWY